MQALVRELGHPERAFRAVLVAGTNGKGSVCSYLDAGLRAAGLRVGLYTSPHLEDVRERIVVDGAWIPNRAFEACVLRVRDAAERLIARRAIAEHPHHFEILTAAAFLHFRNARVEVAVLEVGLGGRLDATNVSDPDVSAIVSIDFDHEEYLGNTLRSIAAEKAGVARRGRPLVLGPVPPEAERSIRSSARKAGARVVAVRPVTSAGRLRTKRGTFSDLHPLPGPHQNVNLAVAAQALEELARVVPLDVARAIKGMNDARWPGRLERIPGRPVFVLDGAHNVAGAAALARALRADRIGGLLIFGAMRDKRIAQMGAALFPLFREVILTRVRMKRAATAGEIRRVCRFAAIGEIPFLEARTPREAIATARRRARRGEAVVVAGSLYLVGAIRRLLRVRA